MLGGRRTCRRTGEQKVGSHRPAVAAGHTVVSPERPHLEPTFPAGIGVEFFFALTPAVLEINYVHESGAP